MTDAIIETVDACLVEIKSAFKAKPTLFYTETDLVCWFVESLNHSLGEAGKVSDTDGKPHRLVHTEYPTPFRCHMAGGGFELKTDEDCVRDKKRYGRGHLDVVIMNPAFIASYDYHLLKAQDFEAFKAKVLAAPKCTPMLIYAVEFFLSRDEIKQSRGPDKTLAAHRCAQGIFQDAKKLEAATGHSGFVKETKHVAFLKGTGQTVQEMIREAIGGRERIELVFAD